MIGFDQGFFEDGATVCRVGGRGGDGRGRGIELQWRSAFLRCGAQSSSSPVADLSHVEGDLLSPPSAGARGRAYAPDRGPVEARGRLRPRARDPGACRSGRCARQQPGTMGGRIPAGTETREDYDHVLDLNIRSVVALTGALLRLSGRREGASIVNTVSISGRSGGKRGICALFGRQGLRVRLDQDARQELAPDGIIARQRRVAGHDHDGLPPSLLLAGKARRHRGRHSVEAAGTPRTARRPTSSSRPTACPATSPDRFSR